MSARFLILGKRGQVGKALADILGADALVASTQGVDLAAADVAGQLDRVAHGYSIEAVINAAAYTQVDKAEKEKDAAFRINAEAVGEIALWCKARNIPLVHFSTDYVFDGSGTHARREDEPAAPLNAYGQGKLAGEKAVQQAGCDHLIFRTSWVYDAYGSNFFNTMLRLFKEKDSLDVVSDQTGAPTYAPHLARAVAKALRQAKDKERFPSGIYHLCGDGETSWYGFAQLIFTLARSRDSGIRCGRIKPIPSSNYPTPAKRPLNSRLDCSKAMENLGVGLPDWKAGLAECIEEKYGRTELQNCGA